MTTVSEWSPVGTSSGHHNYITETFGFSHQIPFVWINALHADIPGLDKWWASVHYGRGKRSRWDEAVRWGSWGNLVLKPETSFTSWWKLWAKVWVVCWQWWRFVLELRRLHLIFLLEMWPISKVCTGWIMHQFAMILKRRKIPFLHTIEVLFV